MKSNNQTNEFYCNCSQLALKMQPVYLLVIIIVSYVKVLLMVFIHKNNKQTNTNCNNQFDRHQASQ